MTQQSAAWKLQRYVRGSSNRRREDFRLNNDLDNSRADCDMEKILEWRVALSSVTLGICICVTNSLEARGHEQVRKVVDEIK
jgi:hypothetical protein